MLLGGIIAFFGLLLALSWMLSTFCRHRLTAARPAAPAQAGEAYEVVHWKDEDPEKLPFKLVINPDNHPTFCVRQEEAEEVRREVGGCSSACAVAAGADLEAAGNSNAAEDSEMPEGKAEELLRWIIIDDSDLRPHLHPPIGTKAPGKASTAAATAAAGAAPEAPRGMTAADLSRLSAGSNSTDLDSVSLPGLPAGSASALSAASSDHDLRQTSAHSTRLPASPFAAVDAPPLRHSSSGGMDLPERH